MPGYSFLRLHLAAEKSTKNWTYWSGAWPGTDCWSTGSAARQTARTRSSSSRRWRIIGRARRRSAMQMFWCYRGLHICAAAATRWCWNRRARARCSKFATRNLWPQLPSSRRHKRSNASADGVARRTFSRCWSILKSSSKSMRAAAASGPTRAMTIWFFGTFTISCSTPAARKADTPTCSAEFFLMSAPYRRYRRCGLVGPERKSICASFRRSRRQQ